VLTIRLNSPVPLGDQIVTGLRQLIAAEHLRPGDELPPVRQLAADLGINLNTVARAYRELEQDGLVSTGRGRGTRVTADRIPPLSRPEGGRAEVIDRLRAALAEAKLAGLTEEEVTSIVRQLMSGFWRSSPGVGKE